ncbi:hypothetical protein B0H17DRAFT_1190230 [Mycena rosella]|uniref:Uncharacterized protein n=1 Tax=Mycena rosella TaxID=1033263 RepID=A0AAD7H363_MYCRO|nr:hypothetical protein B0H17DRAFT_1190230 [Mycena rosella]
MSKNDNSVGGTTGQGNRGANAHRTGNTGRTQAGGAGGRKPKKTSQKDLEAELAALKAKLAQSEAAQKKLEEQAARGAAPEENGEVIERIERPQGEAGDSKNGFILQDAMGLQDDRLQYEAIGRTMRKNVIRADIDYTIDFRRQDPAKLAMVYKLTRKAFPYLTRARFPLDWAVAEMVKQYLRNKRRYGVKKQYIPDRETRKREREEAGSATRNKRRKGPAGSRHIDDVEEDEEDAPGNADSGGPVEA